MIAIVFSLCILIVLLQARRTFTSVRTYWNVRESKDTVKAHFHKQEALHFIQVLGAMVMILLLYSIVNF